MMKTKKKKNHLDDILFKTLKLQETWQEVLCFHRGNRSWPVEFWRVGIARRSFQEQLYKKILCVSWKGSSLKMLVWLEKGSFGK